MTIFSGSLTERDHKNHIPIHFEVPSGTTRIIGKFSAEPRRATGALFDNLIFLSIFGPHGARGARHNNDEMDFVIDAAAATPGYVAGEIEPGQWTVFMDTFRLLGPDPVSYVLDIRFENQQISQPVPMQIAARSSRGAGWYCGDLHAHTWHSDASWDIPYLFAWAKKRKLDFMTLTDHNTVSGHAEVLALADDALLTIGGVELTTHSGHALSLGGRDWQEWRVGTTSQMTMPLIAEQVVGRGNVYIIAHPMAPGDPACTGCRWEYQDMMPGPARVVEIWNGGPWSDYNEEGLALYRRWLSEGHRLVATSGSDIHGPEGSDGLFGFNHVYASDLTEEAVLAAVAAGRNYLSSGPKLILNAVTSTGKLVSMGETVDPAAQPHVDWSSKDVPLTLAFYDATGLIEHCALAANSIGQHVLSASPETFVMAELRDASGLLHAVTNPIFVA
jgi:hypothetical protein